MAPPNVDVITHGIKGAAAKYPVIKPSSVGLIFCYIVQQKNEQDVVKLNGGKS